MEEEYIRYLLQFHSISLIVSFHHLNYKCGVQRNRRTMISMMLHRWIIISLEETFVSYDELTMNFR